MSLRTSTLALMAIGIIALDAHGDHLTYSSETCKDLANLGLSGSAECAGLVNQRGLSQVADDVCSDLASLGLAVPAVDCIRTSAGNFFDPVAASVCSELANLGLGSATVQCMAVITNKFANPDLIESCKQSAALGQASQAVACVKNITSSAHPPLPPQPLPPPPPPPQPRRWRVQVRVESIDKKFQESADLGGRIIAIDVIRQLSNTPCIGQINFGGVQTHRVWARFGCRAVFEATVRAD